MSIKLWTSDKTVALSGQREHRHEGRVAPGFTAPSLVSSISFGPIALAAAIGRTATLLSAPPLLVAYLGVSAFAEAQILLADGPLFLLSPLFAQLADSERTHFASRLGAGITDLYMNALDYSWRDNAACLSSSLDPHGDFLYFGGEALGHGVVLAEARGSFAKKTSDAAMATAASTKYLRQVRPYIGASSQHGQVIHGYALAFGAQPNVPGAYLRLSQTLRIKPPRGGAVQPPAPVVAASTMQVPTRMALATHRSNFVLMDALPIADWIDWLGGGRDLPEDDAPVTFARFNYGGRSFVASIDALLPHGIPFRRLDYLYGDDIFWHRRQRRSSLRANLMPFVMEEKAATTFLTALTGLIRRGSRELDDTIELPVGDIIGFGASDIDVLEREPRDGYNYALFRDGLALLAEPPSHRSIELRRWHPKEGFGGFNSLPL